jgi:Protein of unknown function (DUF3500)
MNGNNTRAAGANAPARVAERMGEAVSKLMAALSADQRAKAMFDFANDAERSRWYYTPNPKRGLPLGEMALPQQRLAHQLVATGLSRTGYMTAAAIIGLELMLDAVEQWGNNNLVRDAGLYYVSAFGTPSAREPWGWQFQGHHISLNYTIAGGRLISPTPTFFGSNPAETALGRVASMRPLAGVEDIARELVHSLNAEQLLAAHLAPAAPLDLMQSNRPRVLDGVTYIPPPVMMGQELTDAAMAILQGRSRALGYTNEHQEALRFSMTPKGLPAARMSTAQREILWQLIGEYIGRMPDEIAEIESAQLRAQDIEQVHFVWAGGLERHQAHYYRLQGTRFLVEYDCAQDNANHIHSVWRDPLNDFGADLLAQHYATEHSR